MRSKSETRLERQPGELTLFYKRRGEREEQEMLRITMVDEPKSSTKSSHSGKSKKRRRRRRRSDSKSSRPSSGRSQISISWRSRKGKRHAGYIDRWERELKKNRNKARLTCDSGLDEKTKNVLDFVTMLNEGTRKRYAIGKFSASDSEDKSTQTPSTVRSRSRKSSKSSKLFSSRSSSRSGPAKAYDWQATYKQDVTALTPFPGMRSPATRERARQEESIKWREAGFKPKSKSRSRTKTSSKSATISKSGSEILTAQMYDYRGFPVRYTTESRVVTTPTRYPGARPPEVRAKARLDLLTCVEKKEIAKEKAKKSKKSDSESDSDSSPSEPKSTNTYSNFKPGANCCQVCGGCVECVRICVEHCHSNQN